MNFELAANISLIAIAVLAVWFTVMYGIRSRWWTNPIGRIYLANSALLSLVLGQMVLAVWWHYDYPLRQHVRFVIYTLGAVAYVPMLVSLRREQQRDRRREGH